MPDITMCAGIASKSFPLSVAVGAQKEFECPLKETCYRYKANPSEWQSFFVGVPYENGECEHYIDTSKERV